MSKPSHRPRNPRQQAARVLRALQATGATPDDIRKLAEQEPGAVAGEIRAQVRSAEK